MLKFYACENNKEKFRCYKLQNGESTGVCWRSDNDDVFVKKNDVRFLFIRNERERASEDAHLNFE